MAFVNSGGRHIYYERQGSGPALLFCHGAGSNSATWWQQLPAFAPHYTCLTMDIRCFGRSVAPLEEFTFASFVQDVLAILDQECMDRVTLIGQSLGGMIGLRVALSHPERVASLVACDSTLGIDHAGLLDLLARRQITHRAVSIEERSLGAWFLRQHPDKAQLYAQINHFNPSAHSIAPEKWGMAIGSLLLPHQLIKMPELRQVQCPTLLVVGSEDPLLPVGVAREVAGWMASSRVAVLQDAGHSAYFEKPAEFNRTVLDFLTQAKGSIKA